MTWSFGDFLWSMIVFFFWFTIIWMFIMVFADLFRRKDLSGWAKAGWIILLVLLPALGILIYMVARPKELDNEVRSFGGRPLMGYSSSEANTGYSTADELERLGKLQDQGRITQDEYAKLKQRVMV